MKVLVLSAEVWREDNNGGNVLSNIFEGTGFEFAQIYCNPGKPSNSLCSKYFQITDTMIINNLLKKRPVGKVFEVQTAEKEVANSKSEGARMYSFGRKYFTRFLKVVQELAWCAADWENDMLKKFILDFQPDVIFAPCYASFRMLRLTRFVAELTGKKVISYISDDSHSMRQFNLSPFYWIFRILLRKSLRKTFPYYDLVYTMTEAQKVECERMFGANMKILCKGMDTNKLIEKTQVYQPIRLIFAGGIYCGRWRTLTEVADAIERLRSENLHLKLDIYTANALTKKQEKLLNRDGIVQVHKSVPYAKLKEIYLQYDIALHVESFNLQNKLATRLSFSTKIVDCLSSGCATMAIAWKEQAGFAYLRAQDAAICIDCPKKIYENLKTIAEKPELILHYQKRAVACCAKNHDQDDNLKMILTDFNMLR